MARVSDPFDVVGVARGATSDEIRHAYRRRAKELHPDRAGTSPGAVAAAQRDMAELNRAYAVLVDPDAPAAARVDGVGVRTASRGQVVKRPPGPDECEVCGHAPVASARTVHQVATGWGARRLATVRRCCRDCGMALATDALGRSLARGWWDPVAAVQNVATIRTDLDARATFRELGLPRHVPGVVGRRSTPLPVPRPVWTSALGVMLLLTAIATLAILLLR